MVSVAPVHSAQERAVLKVPDKSVTNYLVGSIHRRFIGPGTAPSSSASEFEGGDIVIWPLFVPPTTGEFAFVRFCTSRREKEQGSAQAGSGHLTGEFAENAQWNADNADEYDDAECAIFRILRSACISAQQRHLCSILR